jgi:hypothetical protein
MKRDLGIYSDWADAAKRQADLYPAAPPGEETRQQIQKVLGFSRTRPVAEDVRIEATWKRDGLAGEAISWSAGYGPRTQAWFLKPDGSRDPLPGIVALHGHDGVKFFGKEKIAESDRYNAAARWHEHLVAKYCTLLGTTLAGVVSFEDRVAVQYLLSRSDVRPGLCGCIGLSGGGCRAALLQATSDEIGAAVIVGMMATQPELLDRHVEPHTWMFFPAGLARIADWPELAASRAPSPLLIQYDRDDQLFPIQGMQAAHARIAAHYERCGQPNRYSGRFYDGPHKFDRTMQKEAFTWLRETMNDK